MANGLGRSHDVVETQDAKSALGLLAASAHYFDLVVVTCVGRRDRPRDAPGIELVFAMFERWPWIPVVVISRAQETARLTADALVSGARELLRRPFTVTDLDRAVTRWASRPNGRAPAGPAVLATMKRILGVLGQHLEKTPTLPELAGMAAMSRSHFSHTFRAVVGMPLRQYVRDLRLKQAHQLLLTSRRSLTDIAVEAGFYDLPHFDKAFRQRIGISPQDYRTRNGQGRGEPAGRGKLTGQRSPPWGHEARDARIGDRGPPRRDRRRRRDVLGYPLLPLLRHQG